MESPSGIVTLLTDFGLADHYVGVMKGVIWTIFPEANICDVTHGVQPYSVEQGAFFLEQSYSRFPEGTVHVVVVDPGVGTSRRHLAAEAGGRFMIGPDNGVFSLVLERHPDAMVREVDAERYGLKPRSKTFHGRDVFSPAAAHLARGAAFSDMGPVVENYIKLPRAKPEQVDGGTWRGRVLNVDRFGNIVTSFPPHPEPVLEVSVGSLAVTASARTYDDAPESEPFMILGSSGYLEVSIRRASAADTASIRLGDPVELRVA